MKTKDEIMLSQHQENFNELVNELLMTMTSYDNTNPMDDRINFYGHTSNILFLRKKIAQVGTEIDYLKKRVINDDRA